MTWPLMTTGRAAPLRWLRLSIPFEVIGETTRMQKAATCRPEGDGVFERRRFSPSQGSPLETGCGG